MPTAMSAAPGRSILMRRAPRSPRRMNNIAPRIASGAMITLIRNAQRHE